MIIQIDTDKESPERLRRIASFLERLAGDGPSSSKADSDSASSADMFTMFGGDDDGPDAATARLATELLDETDDDTRSARVTTY